MTDAAMPKDRRNHPRRSVIWLGTLKVGKFSFPCRVLNLSLGGARIHLALPLKEGAGVTLSIPRCHDLPAKVVWSKGDVLRLNFILSPQEVSVLLGEAAVKTLGLDRMAQGGGQ